MKVYIECFICNGEDAFKECPKCGGALKIECQEITEILEMATPIVSASLKASGIIGHHFSTEKERNDSKDELYESTLDFVLAVHKFHIKYPKNEEKNDCH